MRVRHLTDTFLPKLGGLEITLDALVRAMLTLGVDCDVIAPRPTPLAGSLPYPVVGYRRLKSSRLAAWWLRRALARADRELDVADVYVGHHAYPCGAAVVEHVRRLRSAGKTAVAAIHVHGGDVYQRSRWRRKPAAWHKLTHALRAADRVVTSTEVMRQTVLEIIGPGHPSGHVCIVPNGVEAVDPQANEPCPRFESAPFAGKPFVLALGRLILRKGFDTLIEAARESGVTDLTVVIAGDGPERARLEQLCRSLPPTLTVHFVGAVDGVDKRWLLQRCLLMAAPSVEESFGIVALEAMSFGKPVIGTSGTGFAEIIAAGQTGWLVPPGDSRALAEALRQATADACRQMSAACLAQAGRFAWRVVAASYVTRLTKPTS